MHRVSIAAAGAFVFLAFFPGTADHGAAASAARLWYGTCFPQFHKCMSRCNALDAQAFESCSASCGQDACESDREMARREAFNGNLPESSLPSARLPESTLPDGNLPESQLP